MLAAVRDNAGAPAPNSGAGWAVAASAHSASTGCYIVVYANYTPAASAVEVFDTGNRDQWCGVGWEIANLAGSIVADFIAATLNAAALVGGNFPFTTGSFNTANANELILGAACVESPSTPTLTMAGTGFATDATLNNTAADFFGSFDSAIGGHRTTSFSGTAVAATFNGGPNGSFAEYAMVELQSSPPPTPGGGNRLTLLGVS